MSVAPKFLNKLIPEVNFWVNRTMYNNLFNKKMINCPTKISDFWRSKDSVVELIFNETADPSGTEYDDGYHFIWKYRTINLGKLHIVEPLLFKRIQIYYNSTWVYAAKDDPKYSDIFNLADSQIELDNDSNNNSDYLYGIVPGPYINYNSHIVTSGTDQLHYDDAPTEPIEDEKEPIVYKEAENVFGLTEEELGMCEYLYLYRTGQYELIEPFDQMFYYTLESPLSKWIYIYLLCYLFNEVKWEYLYTITKEEDGYFRCLCEKHLQDRVYEYIQKHNMTLWEKIINSGRKDKRSFTNYTLSNLTYLQKGRLTEDNINDGLIIIESIDKQPNNRDTFEFIYDGLKLKQKEDYQIMNIQNESEPLYAIRLSKSSKINYTLNTKFQLMYNYQYLKTPFTGVYKFDFK